jgi:hypothetical protein
VSAAISAERRGGGWRPLGELLVLRGLLAEDDVASALLEQRRNRRRLGQILVARGVLSRAALESTLAEQAGRLEPESGFGAGLRDAIDVQRAGRRRTRRRSRPPLGEYLVRRGYLTDEDISRALADQAKSGKLIGEILVERGAVAQPVVSRALEEQASGALDIEHGFGTGLRDAIARHGAR